jgi:hypothetical protein
MKTILTPQLLEFLIEQGYTHCFSHSEYDKVNQTRIVTLTPVKAKPDLELMAEDFDTFYKITGEPLQMTLGLEGTKIYLNLDLKMDKRTFLMLRAYGVETEEPVYG